MMSAGKNKHAEEPSFFEAHECFHQPPGRQKHRCLRELRSERLQLRVHVRRLKQIVYHEVASVSVGLNG